MAIYTILLALSVFMIAIVLFIIQQTFFHWKREHKEEALSHATENNHPAVGIMMTVERCILRRKYFPGDIVVYDHVTRSDISLQPSPSAHTIDNSVTSV